MYLVRRVFKIKPGTTFQAAHVIHQMGKLYEEAGQRSPTRVYWSGGSLPGPKDIIYMEWTEEEIRPPRRKGHKLPDGIVDLTQQLRLLMEETHIEFYSIFDPEVHVT